MAASKKANSKKVATVKASNKKAVVAVVAVVEDKYILPQSMPLQERSRNATRRVLHKFLVTEKLAGKGSTPANPKSIALTAPQMKMVEAKTAAIITEHFATTEYTPTEIALAVKQLSESQSNKCGGTITVDKLRKNTENFYTEKFAKKDHFPRKSVAKKTK